MSALTSWPEQALRAALARPGVPGDPAPDRVRDEARRRGWRAVQCIGQRCRRYTLIRIPDEDPGREVLCPHCRAARVAGFNLDDVIDEVLDDHNEPELGMTAADAALLVDELIAEDRDDERALQAHDLLHQRAVFGRAW